MGGFVCGPEGNSTGTVPGVRRHTRSVKVDYPMSGNAVLQVVGILVVT